MSYRQRKKKKGERAVKAINLFTFLHCQFPFHFNVLRGNRTWVVCNYDPPGNIMGNFLDCVPHRVEEKLEKIIERMKTRRKFLDWKKDLTDSTTEMAIDPASFAAKDLKLWTKFELECLDKHNYYRSLHGVPALKLNRQLCKVAEEWSLVWNAILWYKWKTILNR